MTLVPSQKRVVDATADAPQAFFIPSGHSLTCQVQWTLMRLLPEEENEFKTVTHMHTWASYIIEVAL